MPYCGCIGIEDKRGGRILKSRIKIREWRPVGGTADGRGGLCQELFHGDPKGAVGIGSEGGPSVLFIKLLTGNVELANGEAGSGKAFLFQSADGKVIELFAEALVAVFGNKVVKRNIPARLGYF